MRKGQPGRPRFKHTIYAPGEYTEYDAASIPGLNEALDAGDLMRARAQLAIVIQAFNSGIAIQNTSVRKANYFENVGQQRLRSRCMRNLLDIHNLDHVKQSFGIWCTTNTLLARQRGT